LIILLVGISGVYTIMNLNDLNRLIESIIRYDSRIIKLSEEALDELYSLTAVEDKHRISGDQDYYQQFKQTRIDLTEKVNELERIADTEVKIGIVTDLIKSKSRYDKLLDTQKSSTSRQKTEYKNYRAYIADRERITHNIDQKLRHLMKVSTEDRNSKIQKSNVMSAHVTNIIIISEVLAIILVVIITFINTRKINSPIKLLRERIEDVDSGKSCVRVEISSPPEISELADSFNTMCDRLEELDQMKIDYISHLSHVLRTPLTVIKEASFMLQEGVFSKVPEKQEELFMMIKAECERLISSVNRILDFSRMEAGDMYFSFEYEDIRPIIENNITKLSPLTRKKHMDIILDIPNDIPPLRIDGEKIEEVFENLLSNALKYTADNGMITISAKNNIEDHTVEISVSDNGQGIPEDGLMQVFDKFKRVDDRRGAIMGTGLGLTIVRHIINAHGGLIWVKSKVGEGSTFTFSLPAS
jgi:two-component system, NtrC family, sensor histidine kinase GlrK